MPCELNGPDTHGPCGVCAGCRADFGTCRCGGCDVRDQLSEIHSIVREYYGERWSDYSLLASGVRDIVAEISRIKQMLAESREVSRG